jgi:hypothetical protein
MERMAMEPWPPYMRYGVTVVIAIFVPHFAFMQIAAHV